MAMLERIKNHRLYEFARGVYHRVRRQYRLARDRVLHFGLIFLNRFSRRAVTGSAPVVVSLTSYGKRAEVCGYAIESIVRGSVRPQRFILWLDEAELLASPPKPLKRLMARGLEIRATENYGPHKKYYPAVAAPVAPELPLVTADDDTIYPRSWLAGLLAAHRQAPADVVCYRAWVMQVGEEGIAPYDSWPNCRSSSAKISHFATGISGVLYPPALQAALAVAGTRFMEVTPRADDIWLHWMALRTDTRIRQVSAKPVHYPTIPGTADTALLLENVLEAGNDRAISRLYEAADVELLRAHG